jgi:hypothetical protein
MGVILITSKRIKGKDLKETTARARDVPLEP